MPELSYQERVGVLYHEHHGWLQGWLRKQLGSGSHAADMMHDTFVRLMHTRRDPASLHEPRAYLATIARGLLVDHFRRQGIERAWLETLAARPEQVAPSAEEQALIIEALVRIDALLDSLPVQTRDIFLLSQLDGMTYAAIASRLGLSLITVKRHMRKGFMLCLQVMAS